MASCNAGRAPPPPLGLQRIFRHFAAYGVLNPRYEPGHSAFGIPLPGVLLVSPAGEVLAKFAEPDYRDRPDFAAMRERVARRLEERDGGR